MNAMNNLELKKIKENPLYIREIENPSEEMQLEAIKKNPFTIQYIENQCKKC